MTNEQTIAGVGDVTKYVQDIGIALLSLGPVPLTVLAGVIIGLLIKMGLNTCGAKRGRDVVIPLFVIVGTSIVFWAIQPESVESAAPFSMKYPVIRTLIVGATLGFVSIWAHRRFIRGTLFEKVLVGDSDGEPNKPDVDSDGEKK